MSRFFSYKFLSPLVFPSRSHQPIFVTTGGLSPALLFSCVLAFLLSCSLCPWLALLCMCCTLSATLHCFLWTPCPLISLTWIPPSSRTFSHPTALLFVPLLSAQDEPSSGMDPRTKRHLWKIISEEVKGKCAVVLTSHRLEKCCMCSFGKKKERNVGFTCCADNNDVCVLFCVCCLLICFGITLYPSPCLCLSVWRSVRHCAAALPSWWKVSSDALGLCSTLRTG